MPITFRNVTRVIDVSGVAAVLSLDVVPLRSTGCMVDLKVLLLYLDVLVAILLPAIAVACTDDR